MFWGNSPGVTRLTATRHVVGSDPDYVLLRVGGELTLTNVSELRDALLKCVAEQPAGVIVELDRLRVGDKVCLTVFHSLARWAGEWPGCTVVLCRPAPQVRAMLRRLAVDGYLPVVDTRAEADRVVRRAGAVTRLSRRLAPVPESIQVGRWLAVTACGRWGLAGSAEHAGQIVTELVGNAVWHARTPIDLILTQASRTLHIAVRDRCPRLPRQRTPDHDDDHGHGLLVVEAFANSYGVAPTSDGKVVWATLPVN